jgi:hypothetical protein
MRELRPLKIIARNLLMLAFALLMLFVGYPVYQEWSKKRDTVLAEHEKAQASERIGNQASLAGAMLHRAHKACSIIGAPDLEECAIYKGQLIQEKDAQERAKLALVLRATYYSNCQRFNTSEFCNNLLGRAIQLNIATPLSRTDND